MNPHYFFNLQHQTLPIILPSIRPRSAMSWRRRFAYNEVHPTISATSEACTLAVSSAFAKPAKRTSSVYSAANLALLSVRFTVVYMWDAVYILYAFCGKRKL